MANRTYLRTSAPSARGSLSHSRRFGDLGRFHTLDGMRGVAAILVAVYHLGQRPGGVQLAGYLAVDLFFALSGFVIALNYVDRFSAGLSAGRFFELRFIRLFPLHAMGTLLGAAKQVIGVVIHDPRAMHVGALAAAVGLNVLMLPDVLTPEMFPLNGPSWSLFFEIVVNVCFAAFLWKAPTPVLLTIMALAFVGLVYEISAPLYFNVGWGWANFYSGIFRTTYSFLAGVLIFRHLPFQSRSRTWFSLVPLVAMAAAMLLLAPSPARVDVELAVVVLGFPALVVAGILLEAPARLASIFSFLGDLSYPIYAIHWPLIAIAYPIAMKLHFAGPVAAMLFIVILIPAAYVAAKIDVAARSKLSGWAKLRRTAPTQAV